VLARHISAEKSGSSTAWKTFARFFHAMEKVIHAVEKIFHAMEVLDFSTTEDTEDPRETAGEF
jgi:hypothetical protein